MICNQCGGSFAVGPSMLEPDRFDLLACTGCGRPVRLVLKGVPRVPSRAATRADRGRALRAARRAQIAREAA